MAGKLLPKENVDPAIPANPADPAESLLPYTIRLTFLALYLCANLINVAVAFQVLNHLNDFEIIGYGGHFVFQNKAKIFLRQNICRPGLFMVYLCILKPLHQKKGEVRMF